jgi:phenylalanyl-tRNA synthetase beta chain
MPTISVEKHDLLQLLGKKYTVEELESLVDLVKGELKEYNPDTDEVKIELKDTNRPDLWCPEGIARQIRFTFDEIDYRSLLDFKGTKPEKTVLVEKKLHAIRPYIGAFIAKGVPVTEQFLIQMIQTQEKLCDGYGKKRELIAIGIYNAEKITFPVYYKAVEPHEIRFVPLGSEEEMDLADILIQHPKGIEFANILRGQEHYPILLDDRNDVLSFPPVINSRTSGEILVGDHNLFVEITGMDLDMTLHAVNILAYNFKDRGFEIEAVMSVYPYETAYGYEVVSPYPLQNKVKVDCALFEDYLGDSYILEEIVTGLKKYGLTVQEGQVDVTSKTEPTSEPTSIVVSTYPYRLDYMHAVDVVEDFAISIGYNSFEPIMPERFTTGHLAPMTLFEDRMRETLIGFGFEEVILNILTNKEDFGEKVDDMYDDLLEISNPMTETYSSLRNSLIPSLLKVEAKSFKSMYPHKVFEVGEVVVRDETKNHGCATRTRLGGLLSYAEANFSEMGSYLNHLQYLMFWDTRIQAKHFPIFIEGRSGEIMAGDNPVGMIGEIHPEILDKWSIKMPTVLFELDLSVLNT